MKRNKCSAAEEAARKTDMAAENQTEEPGAETFAAIRPEKPAARPVHAAPTPAAKHRAARTANVTQARRAEVRTNKARK